MIASSTKLSLTCAFGALVFQPLSAAAQVGQSNSAIENGDPFEEDEVGDDGDDQDTISSTILKGTQPIARPPVQRDTLQISGGDISLNFPSTDVRTVAQAVLGDLLQVQWTVEPGLTAPVTVVTSQPISRQSVLPFLEEALRDSDMALIESNGLFRIAGFDQARRSGAGDGRSSNFGFSTEIVELQYVNAQEMERLLEPVLPGVVKASNARGNSVTISGTTGQRASARDLLRQFDVNWLRGMSFALFIPQKTDSRLIVPELEKLLNGPGSPTNGLVRLIAMESLNGILAISRQSQYLDDVNRFIEILDREGQNNEARLFVYRVQNGRSRDLARTLNRAFGNAIGGGDGEENNNISSDVQFSQSPDGNGQQNDRGGGNGFSLGGGAARGGGQGFGGGQDDFGDQDQAPLGAVGRNGGSAIAATISSDDNNNAIVVFGTPREYAIIEEALRKLDVLPQQILIEASITEVALNDDLRYGLQWDFTSGTENAVLTDSTSSLGLNRQVPGFSFAFSPFSTLSGVLNTLQNTTDINVVSAPKLLVLNNQTAVLQVGDEVPVQTQSSVSNIDANAPTVNAIEYRNTGVILTITPRVNASGTVLLDIVQEVSDVNEAASVDGIESPTISTRRISTSVAVKDGEVLALGGLIRNTRTKGRIGIPFLSQIPIIGGLFGTQTNTSERTELIVLIKPRVLRGVDDARAVTDELRAKIKSLETFISGDTIP